MHQLAEEHLRRWAMFCARVAEATGRTAAIGEDAAGRFLSPAEAVDYGIVDSVAGPDAPIGRLPPRPVGFRPR